MAYRSPRKTSGKSFGRKFQFSKVLPIWGVSHTNVVNMTFEALMHKLGIGTMQDYFRKLRILIAISVIVCALIGASNFGIKGFAIGGLLGLAAPVAILYCGVLLIGVVAFLAIFCLAWALILWAAWWLLHS